MKYLYKAISIFLLSIITVSAKPQSQFFMLMAGAQAQDVVKLAEGTIATGSTTGDLSISSYTATYKFIIVRLYNLTFNTEDAKLNMRLSANGSTYDAGASDYKWKYSYGSGANSNNTDAFELFDVTSNSTTQTAYVEVMLVSPSNATLFPQVRWYANYLTSSASFNNAAIIYGHGYRQASQATQALRFLPSSGTFGASYQIYGVK